MLQSTCHREPLGDFHVSRKLAIRLNNQVLFRLHVYDVPLRCMRITIEWFLLTTEIPLAFSSCDGLRVGRMRDEVVFILV